MMFKIGDKVEWYGNTQGGKYKSGVVVKILAPREPLLKDELSKLGSTHKLGAFHYQADGNTLENKRDTESYIIAVEVPNAKKPELYRPMVESLRLVVEPIAI